MWRFQHAVALFINHRPLALGVTAPQQKDHTFTFVINDFDDPVGKRLPALALMRRCAGAFNGEYTVKQ